MDERTPVLIAGGSLSGLSTALFLANRGVPCTVVERESHRSVQFRFSGIHARSMELYRSAGIDADIRAASIDCEQPGGVARVRTLADPEPRWFALPWDGDARWLSPSSFCTCPQDRLELVLDWHARKLGAQVSFNRELRSFRQDNDGVTAVIFDRTTGAEYTVRTPYLIAADGAHGRIREELGIAHRGPGVLEYWMNIIFRSDLKPEVAGSSFRAALIEELNGSLVPRATGLWQLALAYQAEAGPRGEDAVRERFTEQRCLELIRTAAGQPSLQAMILDVKPWQASACVADSFRSGRVFLVGDAAHLMPPTGAFGGNTGIQDAHNLAWKLAAVLSGTAGPGLLDSYEAERKPVAEEIMAEALLRLRSWFGPTRKDPPAGAPTADNTVMFGYRYRSAAVLGEDDADADHQDRFTDPRAVPVPIGVRAPHIGLDRDGSRVSTLDLIGSGFTLLAGPDGAQWCVAAREVAAATNIGVACHRIGPGQHLRALDGQWTATYGIGNDGAVLIRPDGFIAWRSREAAQDAGATLRDVLGRLLARR
jgi:putative polyketide hydroxylase